MAGERILLIEHDPRIREAAARILDALDFTVFEADDAQSGLASFEAEGPGIVVVDESLPWVGGLDVCARMLAAEPTLTVVVLTRNELDAPLLREAREAYGLQHFVRVPFSDQALADAVLGALGVPPTPAPTALAGQIEAVESPEPRRVFGAGVAVATEFFVADVPSLTASVEAVDSLDASQDDVDSSFFHDADPPSGTSLRAETVLDGPPAASLGEVRGEADFAPTPAPPEDEGHFALRPMTAVAPTDPQGIYKNILLADLLYRLFREIFTGGLVLKRGPITKTVVLRNGFPVAVESDVRSEGLVWRLRLEGVLTEAAHRHLKVLMEQRGLDTHDALTELGVIGPAELFEFQKRLVRERLVNCFDWTDARYGLTYASSSDERTRQFEVNPLVIIFEGIKRSFPIAPMVAHFDTHGGLVLRRTEKLRDYGRLLRDFAEELRLADLCDGTLSLGELISRSPFGLVETLRIVRALEAMQCVEFDRSVPNAAARGAAGPRERSTLPGATPAAGMGATGNHPALSAPATARTTRPSLPPRSMPPVATPSPRAPTPAAGMREAASITTSGQQPAFRPAAVTAGPPPQATSSRAGVEEAVRHLIHEKFGVLATVNHYQLLDVSPDAPLEVIRAAFMRLAKVCQSDQLGASADDETRRRAGEVQRRLATAWEALSDTRRRAEYDALHMDLPVDVGGKPDLVKAEANFQKGRTCLNKGEQRRALEFFEAAVRQDPHQPAYRVHRGWVRFLCADAGDNRLRTEAREEIKIALTEDPNIDAGYVFMGNISKAAGNEELAERFYRKALALNPASADAQREIRLLDARRREKGRDGLLNKIFKK